MKIRTSEYAQKAYQKVEAQKNTPIEAGYRTQAMNFNSKVLQSGLAQATGFLLAKGKFGETGPTNEEAQYLNDIADILGYDRAQALHQAVIASDVSQYQLLTRQAMQVAGWLMRYAQALLSPTVKGLKGSLLIQNDDLPNHVVEPLQEKAP